MDEEQLAPLPRHELDMVPPEMSQLFRDIIKYRVDPAGDYYGITVDQLVKQIQKITKYFGCYFLFLYIESDALYFVPFNILTCLSFQTAR